MSFPQDIAPRPSTDFHSAQNSLGQGCQLDQTNAAVSAFSVPVTDSVKCINFSDFGVPFSVKSAEIVDRPTGYTCQGMCRLAPQQ